MEKFVRSANNGKTPKRESYTEDGVFAIKVGNLTGRGIDWRPRDRNFVSYTEATRRNRSEKLTLRKGDVLLTSSAHAAKYIAKKVDILAQIPKEYGQQGVTFVGEVMRVRAYEDVDTYILLAALRHPFVQDRVRASVRGQTAHLHPSDFLKITIPFDLRTPPDSLRSAASWFRKEAGLAAELSSVSLRASSALESTAVS